jgi:hypothetical protein
MRLQADGRVHVIEVNPNNASALNYLGYMWAERGQNLTEAHDLIEKAVRRAASERVPA